MPRDRASRCGCRAIEAAAVVAHLEQEPVLVAAQEEIDAARVGVAEAFPSASCDPGDRDLGLVVEARDRSEHAPTRRWRDDAWW